MTDITTQSEADPKDKSEPMTSSAILTSTTPRTGRTRLSAAWAGFMGGALALALILVFILKNTKSVKISYFAFDGSMPLGIALLLAAIAGALLAGGVASLRIWQLRHRLTQKARSSSPDSMVGQKSLED